MLDIVLVTVSQERFCSFAEKLSSDPDVFLDLVSRGSQALEIVRNRCPHLVIIDCELPDIEPLDLIRDLIAANAMVNTAVVSPLSDHRFHETGEGLGILCRIPPEPGIQEAGIILEKLRGILGLTL